MVDVEQSGDVVLVAEMEIEERERAREQGESQNITFFSKLVFVRLLRWGVEWMRLWRGSQVDDAWKNSGRGRRSSSRPSSGPHKRLKE
jgi:hypothetical protein